MEMEMWLVVLPSERLMTCRLQPPKSVMLGVMYWAALSCHGIRDLPHSCPAFRITRHGTAQQKAGWLMMCQGYRRGDLFW
jgi:hypothetical protein